MKLGASWFEDRSLKANKGRENYEMAVSQEVKTKKKKNPRKLLEFTYL